MKKILGLIFGLCTASHAMCAVITWNSPVTLSTAFINASDPQVAMDSSGNAVALWVEGSSILSSTRLAQGTWSPSTTVSSNSASSPRLGVDANGNAVAIWLEGSVVKAANLPFGGSWSATATLSIAGTSSSPELAVDASGNAVAVWVQSGFIESSTRLSGGSWSLATARSTNGTEDVPKVSIGANGTVVAVWHSLTSGQDQIFWASSPISGSWGIQRNILAGSAAFSHNFPKIAVDPFGNAVAIWWRYNFSNSIYQNITLLTASLTAGSTTWSVPAALSTGGMSRSMTNVISRVRCDGTGNAVAVWTSSYDGQIFNIETSARPYGGSWMQSALLIGQNLLSYRADVSVSNAIGEVLSGFMVFDGSSSSLIQTAESNIAGPILNFWSVPSSMPGQTGNNGYPRVASSLFGSTLSAVAVWIHSDGVTNSIQASTGSRAVVLPPTNLSVTQNVRHFGVVDEYYNTISWQASPSENLVQYNIYRNGVFFTSVDADTLEVIDDNATQSGVGAVTYGVAAYDSISSQSSIANVVFP